MMTLGERICAQRTAHNLSQSDLAEQLEVSRQSISKWETDASVPELDKLIRMGQLFGVSMDELVLGEEPPPQPATESRAPGQPVERGAVVSRRFVVGCILLALGAAAILLVALTVGDLLGGAVLSLPFVSCGLICLTVRRHPALVCLWVLWFMLAAYLRLATGIRIWWVTSIWLYRTEMAIHAIIAWAQVLTLALLVWRSVYVFRKGKGTGA